MKVLPILSGTLDEIITSIVTKTQDPIAKEILDINSIVNSFNEIEWQIPAILQDSIISNIIDSKITDEVRMLSIRMGEFEISFLPKGKDPEYGPNKTWMRKNRQTGKPARIFQKLLKREFKTREWEIFTNLFKAELCQCAEFQIVEGEDIRYWYNEDHYYKIEGTLGNSCMRYDTAQCYFDVYVDKAKMLITTKNGFLTGRALVWTIGDVTILDRIYTCFDYLENCFIDYAKEHNWWIRVNNSLLNTGCAQEWLSPDNNYEDIVCRVFTLSLDRKYEYFPYMDSFRYYDGTSILSTDPGLKYALDCTDGDYRGEEYTCARCGAIFYGYDGETPDELFWSEWADAYYCGDCCWYSDGLDDYIPVSEEAVTVYGIYSSALYPQSYIDDSLVENPDGTETSDDIVLIDNSYYFVTTRTIWNADERKYEIRSSTR